MPNEKAGLRPAFERNNVPVVLSANNLYAPYAGVFIQSLLDHAGEANNYDVIILNRDISGENQRLIKGLAAGHGNVSIRFYDFSPFFASFHFVDAEHNWPLENFCKVAAPHILNYPGRMIVLDADTLLRTDIARLMDEDLEGCCVAGVSNAPGIYAKFYLDLTFYPNTKNIKARDYYPRTCGIKDHKNYESYRTHLNGGLWLFDCDKYVRKLDLETLLNTAREGDYLFFDEDILYVLLKEDTKLLDPAWNALLPLNARSVEYFNVASEIYDKVYNENGAYQRSHKDPCLLHWVGKPKPWVCPDVPWGAEWWQTALRTPFVGHIISRMVDELGKRRQYYRERYGIEDVDVWEPVPKGIDRTRNNRQVSGEHA